MEFKFKFWDTQEEIMITEKKDYIKDYWDDCHGMNIAQLVNGRLNENRYIPLMYTGLKDKNGNEIFVGDILRWLDSEILLDVVMDFGLLSVFKKHVSRLEVIGNKFEDKKLAKEVFLVKEFEEMKNKKLTE